MNQQVNEDLNHLKILSIFYYVAAGLTLFPMLYGLFYVIFGLFFGAAIMATDVPNRPGEPSPEVMGGLFGGIFAVIGFIILVISLVVGILLFKAGRNISKQQSYTFCFVVACICCVFAPLGTVLGIFTIIVLMRESVKALFEGQNYQRFGNTPPSWQ